MQSLVEIKNNQIVVSSRHIASNFGSQRCIKNYRIFD